MAQRMRYFRGLLFLMLSVAVVALFGLSGCGAPTSVGMSCEYNADCGGHGRCLRGSNYPGGTCTIPCDHHSDCPGFASCIDRDGGVCLESCERSRDCRRNYKCSDERNRGSSGRSSVCIGD